jgi:phosphoglycolate phosphatase
MPERTDMSDKIAVIFPGIGYTCDKPLLYYAGKFAQEK